MRFVQIKQQKHHQNVKCRIKTNRFTKKNTKCKSNGKLCENDDCHCHHMHQRRKKTHTHQFKQFWTECIIYSFFRLWRYFHFLFLVIFGAGSGTVGYETFVPCGIRLGAANSTLLVNAIWKTVHLLVPWTFVRGDKIPIRVGFHILKIRRILQIRHRSFYIPFYTICNIIHCITFKLFAVFCTQF